MGLREYILRRLILVIPVVFGAVILVFAITQMIPPAARAILYVKSEKDIAKIPLFIKTYHLDASPLEQFYYWFNELLHGNLGWSYAGRSTVSSIILSSWPATVEIVIFSTPFIIILGIYLGVQSAVYKDKPVDHLTRFFSITGYSLPAFWLALILLSIAFSLTGSTIIGRVSTQYVSVVKNAYVWRTYTGLYTIDGILNGRPDIALDALEHLVMPVAVITIINVAGVIRLMRSSMLEALTKGYIVTARAKGLKTSQVINKHARRNALIPVITLSGLIIVWMLSGLVITETVFGIGGLGNWAARCATTLDIAGVVGFTLFTAILFVVANLIIDVLYGYIDPRIRLG
jgi:dipeptide transport system permease protein